MQSDGHHLAGSQQVAGLASAGSIDPDLAAKDQVGGARPRLSQPGKVEPLVEPLRATRVGERVLCGDHGAALVLRSLVHRCLQGIEGSERRIRIEAARLGARRGGLQVEARAFLVALLLPLLAAPLARVGAIWADRGRAHRRWLCRPTAGPLGSHRPLLWLAPAPPWSPDLLPHLLGGVR